MKKLIIALLGATLALAGCLYPENFKADLAVAKDGSYTMNFDGTAVNMLALLASDGKRKRLSDKDEEMLRQSAAKMSNAPNVKAAEYKGDGRFYLKVEDRKAAGQNLSLFDVFSVIHTRDGHIVVSTPEVRTQDVPKMQQVGLKLKGTFSVTLPSNAKVISQNASSTPGVFSSAYTWSIGDVNVRPRIEFTLTK